MKKVLISVAGILLVALTILVSIKYFRSSHTSSLPAGVPKEYENMADTIVSDDSLDEPAQEGKATEENEQFAADLKTITGKDYNPINITSVGHPIRTGDFSYQVTSWSMSKESPGYPIPEGKEYYFREDKAVLDENENITNDYSYVVVNMEVENLTSEEIKFLIWGIFRLKSVGNGAGKYEGECAYLGDGRDAGQSYYLDTIEANSKKEMPIIFVVKDEYLIDNQLYIEVNPSGVATTNPDYDVKRYIFLT